MTWGKVPWTLDMSTIQDISDDNDNGDDDDDDYHFYYYHYYKHIKYYLINFNQNHTVVQTKY